MSPTKLVTTVLGGLIAYKLSDVFLTSIITGTTAADNLLKGILPIAIGGAVVLAVIVTGYRGGD